MLKGFGRLIAERRELAGLDQGQLAERLGRGRTIVYRLETEQQEPSAEQINILTTVLPMTAEELLRAMGVTVFLPQAAKLPAQLVSKLLAMPPAQLAALTEFLPGEPGSGNRAGQG